MKNTAISIRALKKGDKDALKKQGVQKMTQQEIARRNAEEVAHAQYVAREKYRDERAANYPTVGEQLDALWKMVDALVLNRAIPEEAIAVRDAVASTKKQFPKPEKA